MSSLCGLNGVLLLPERVHLVSLDGPGGGHLRVGVLVCAQDIGHLGDQSVNQSTNQSVNQSINQSTD